MKFTAWRLRSPRANGRLAAFVMGNCGDEFDHGGIGIAGGGGDLTPDKHFVFDTTDVLTVMATDETIPPNHFSNINGVRPALWLRTEG